MSILVIVEHDNQAVNVATLNTVAAAKEIGGDMFGCRASRCLSAETKRYD